MSTWGGLNIPRDVDGVVRRVPLVMGFTYQAAPEAPPRHVFVPSFALLTVMLHLGIDAFPLSDDVIDVHFGKAITIRAKDDAYTIPIDDLGRMRLNYRWRHRDFAAVSFVKLAPPPLESTRAERQALARSWAGLLRGRVAVVGVTVTGVDVGPTPIDANTPLVYVQLTAINDILTRACLRPVTKTLNWLIMLSLLALFSGLCLAVRGGWVVLASFLLLIAYGGVAYGGVHCGIMALPVVVPLVFVVTATFGVLSFRYFSESRARRRIRGMFATMVSGDVLSYLEEHPESFSLEGQTTEATVMFSDISEFTTLSEHLEPASLIQLLNAYLTPITNCVLKWGGYLDKYVGDCVMAVWGAPYADSDHAVRACFSALEQQQLIDALNTEIEMTYGFRLRVRMGINSGEVTAGNVGSERKFQYTVLGDTVNLASRLEPANREFGTGILIGEATRKLVSHQIETREIGRIRVSGREQVVRIHELLGARGSVDPAVLAQQRQYEQALQAFYARDWSLCITKLEAILATAEDGPSVFLLERAQTCQNDPPPPAWDGVYIRTEKD